MSDAGTQPDVRKNKHAELEDRLARTKRALQDAREALAQAKGRELSIRAKLATVQERLRWHERALLRPEVLEHLFPSRAEWYRRSAPTPAALARDATHAAVSTAYRDARDASPPAGAARVEIGGVDWWVPDDARVPGRLADRVLTEKRLPFVDILRAREAIASGVMLDIGANIGLTSVPRVVLGDVDVVYAAEPDADNFTCLVRTIVDNGLRGLILPDRLAMSDRNGHARLQRSPSIGGHALTEAGHGAEVPVETLDTWVTRLGIDMDAVRYVKVDTQGHESHVLGGAAGVLARAGIAWEIEFSPRHLLKAGRTPADLVAQLRAAFTDFVDLNPDAPGDRLRPIAELSEAVAYVDRSYTNLLAYRR